MKTLPCDECIRMFGKDNLPCTSLEYVLRKNFRDRMNFNSKYVDIYFFLYKVFKEQCPCKECIIKMKCLDYCSKYKGCWSKARVEYLAHSQKANDERTFSITERFK